MVRLKFKYGDKEFNTSPYNTKIEKDLLLMESFENFNLDDALMILGMKKKQLKDLTIDEKMALMFHFRSISVGEMLNIKYQCKFCNQTNETQIDISENVIEPKTDIEVKQLFKPVTENNLHEFVDIDLDELDIKEFDELLMKVKQSIVTFNFVKPNVCLKCGKTNHIDVSDPNKILSYMSEDSLVSLYQTYNDMSFFGKYSKADIDSMLPFERSIFIGLLNKTREELNK